MESLIAHFNFVRNSVDNFRVFHILRAISGVHSKFRHEPISERKQKSSVYRMARCKQKIFGINETIFNKTKNKMPIVCERYDTLIIIIFYKIKAIWQH